MMMGPHPVKGPQHPLGQLFQHHRIVASPATVFLGDLPKDINQIDIFEYLKEKVGGEFDLILKK